MVGRDTFSPLESALICICSFKVDYLPLNRSNSQLKCSKHFLVSTTQSIELTAYVLETCLLLKNTSKYVFTGSSTGPRVCWMSLGREYVERTVLPLERKTAVHEYWTHLLLCGAKWHHVYARDYIQSYKAAAAAAAAVRGGKSRLRTAVGARS